MKYISTRGGVKDITFQEAVLMGLADDGGLLIPESIPNIKDKLSNFSKLSYNELATEIISLFASDIERETLKTIVDKSYNKNFIPEVAPLKKFDLTYILELFSGPTLSFKDVALQFIGNLFEYILNKKGGYLNIVGATSGDTGSAGIYGVRGKKNINIFVMHPHNKISKLQELQMTTVLDKNVFNIAVEGSFDDCQKIMKDIASDIEFKKEYKIGAINSVNWARVVAQIVYYIYSTLKILNETNYNEIQIAVPTGNFGNVLAAWYATQMGLPVKRIILATNENDILARFFNTGEYSIGKVVETISPAMDIQVASNFERYLYYKLDCNADKVKKQMEKFKKEGKIKIEKVNNSVDELFLSDSATKKDVIQTISDFYKKFNYILDPHTAVGVTVAYKLKEKDLPILNVATAHPAKFPDAIKDATGKTVAHPELEKLKNMPSRCELMKNDHNAVKNFIKNSLSKQN